MPVIGSAGHVDHGKTALIAALTGIDTDRLPEEKARGMTTDLGFAHFEEGGRRIGVIDVPGHERYIRNMVAGAAGIDGALLVVAADDGWMEQTGRHAEVLLALGVPFLALAVTKISLVGPERPAQVALEALARLRALALRGAPEGAGASPAASPPWLPVDSLSGRGVAELRALLAARILELLPAEGGEGAVAGRPWLFVDRSFSLPGAGHIVAGSLRGGPLRPGERLRLLPSGEELSLRSIQRYGEGVPLAEPGSRVALGFQKSRAEIGRGSCLAAPGGDWLASSSFYLALNPAYRSFRPRPGHSLEVALGSDHGGARVFPSRRPGFLRVLVERPLALRPGLALILLRVGGAEILAAGRVFALGGEEAGERRGIEEALASLGPEAPSFEGALAGFRLAREGCLRRASGLELPADAELAGDWAFSRRGWEALRRETLQAAACPGGFEAASLPGRLGLPRDAAEAALSRLLSERLLVLREGRLRPAGGSPTLPRSAEELRTRLGRLGAAGLDLGIETAPGLKRDLSLLVREGEAVCLDDRLYLAPAVYRSFADSVLGGREPGSRLGLGEAKAATGLSRKWIIPLLNRMEGEGLLKRRGEERIVLAGAGRSGSSSAPGVGAREG